MTLAFTESAKIWVGRLRPDFLDRCKPVDDKCTGSAKSVEEGRKSFFSGHSSISFYGITYLVFWMLEEGWLLLGFYVGRRVTPGFVLLFSMIPLMLPAYVAISRSQQYIHHPTDIITGSLFGSLIAYVMVFYHYRYKK
ncbi:phosphatidic acid phosphatase type 2/haloperoxidase [Globomyces pollinis-pini]|nr:phosphatidic acid phosphatase type 2/haloperoxidase [Globomyces pollinis-pini]